MEIQYIYQLLCLICFSGMKKATLRFALTFDSHFKGVVMAAIFTLLLLVATSTLSLLAPSFTFSLQILSSSNDGVNAK
jgi:hypothetical protein